MAGVVIFQETLKEKITLFCDCDFGNVKRLQKWKKRDVGGIGELEVQVGVSPDNWG